MRAAILSRTERRGLICLVLFVFLLRALIPAGFMPSAGGLFSLELCPSTFPAAWLEKLAEQAGKGDRSHHAHHAHHAQHHHHAQHAGHATTDEAPAAKSSFDHCPFGSAPSVAPVVEPGLVLLAAEPDTVPDFLSVGALPARLIRSQKARAPPVLS